MIEKKKFYEGPLAFYSGWFAYPLVCIILLFIDFYYLHAGVISTLVLLVLGWFFTGLGEYCVHRWVYHHVSYFSLMEGHNLHHAKPQAIIGVPFYYSVPVYMLIVLGIPSLFMPFQYSFALAAGASLGGTYYVIVHFLLHDIKFNKNHLTGKLQHFHDLHHIFPKTNFAVTSPWWDYLFNTQHKPRKS